MGMSSFYVTEDTQVRGMFSYFVPAQGQELPLDVLAMVIRQKDENWEAKYRIRFHHPSGNDSQDKKSFWRLEGDSDSEGAADALWAQLCALHQDAIEVAGQKIQPNIIDCEGKDKHLIGYRQIIGAMRQITGVTESPMTVGTVLAQA